MFSLRRVASRRRPALEGISIGSRRNARARVVDTAYELFSVHGIRAVGVDRISAEAGVTKKTLYSHFRSKGDLVLAFLDEREQRWTRAWLEAEIERLAPTPGDRLLTLFDVLDKWFRRRDFEGCSFISTLLETQAQDGPVHRECRRQLDLIRAMLEEHARQAGAHDPESTGYQVQILMMGAIVSATRGDKTAARRARALAALLVDAAPA
ncbi:MAG TPA: TetR/AcrR family transcriptional regulator [Thermoleophilaceae bacterium]